MHRPTALLASTTLASPVAPPALMTDSPYYLSSVPTPPPSASPADLPPIPEMTSNGRHLTLGKNDTPPSPASPKKQKDALPAYLEPTPQMYSHDESNAINKIRPQLFHLLAPPLVCFPTRRATAPTLTHQQQSIYSSLPKRSYSQSMDHPIRPITTTLSSGITQLVSNDMIRYPSTPSSSGSSSPTTIHQQHNGNKKNKYSNSTTSSLSSSSIPTSPFHQGQDLCTSPTLAAACTSAANMHKPFSSPSSPSSTSTINTSFDLTGHTHSRMKLDDDKKQVDQSMFLTKNAHIKRPRNAWIHFRCHYGQALKIQDPTLRAEEISKRASRRWSLLSEKEKRPWHQLAEQEKQAHKVAFPEYRYCPKRTTNVTTTINQSPTSPVHPHSPQHQQYRLHASNDLDSFRMHKKSKKA
ncbi:hypothetical protein BC941DRAFT_437470 [Chlamydoabsidia padenii]|nr:hypothetical protein BC941DRAFT_437470 [Chlamydoabsidia padenii]